MPGKISFRVGITQIFVFFTLLVAAAITYNFYWRVSQVVLDLSDQITENSATRIIEGARDFLDGPASYTSVVASYLENSGRQDNLVEDHEALWQLMWGPLLITPQLNSLFYADEGGNYVQVRRDPEFSTRFIDRGPSASTPAKEVKIYRDQNYYRITEQIEASEYDPRQRSWYKDSLASNGVTWSPPFISATFKTPLISASVPVLDAQGRARAVVGVSIPSYSISNTLASMPLAARSMMLAVDGEYRLIAHQHKAKLITLNAEGETKVSLLKDLGPFYAALQSVLEQQGGKSERREFSFDHQTYEFHLMPFPPELGKPGWRLIGIVPRGERRSTESSFKEYGSRIFRMFEGPAAEARKLAEWLPYSGDSRDLEPLHEAIWQRLWQSLMAMPQVQSVVIGDAQGSYLQARREPNLATRLIDHNGADGKPLERKIYRDQDYQVLSDKSAETKFDPRERPWYGLTTRAHPTLWSEAHLSSSTSLPVVSATHVVTREDGSKAGMVAANIPLYRLSDFVSQAKASEHAKTMVLDGQGNLIAYPDKRQLLADGERGPPRLRKVDELDEPAVREAYRLMTESPGTRRISFKQDGENYIAVVRPFPENVGQNGWSILTVLPEADILGKVNAILLESALLTAAIFLLAVIAIYWAASAVARPINQLAHSIEGLKEFRLESVEGVYSRFTEVDNISQNILSARDGLAAFRKYVPADLVRQLMQTRQSARLGGGETNLTLMFTDVEGFTSISEELSADDLMHQLSEYLDALSNVILEERGTIDKYIGDAIMTFWGAPEPIDHAPLRACLSALRCREKEENLNARWARQGKPLMHTRFGIHSGKCVVGNVGSSKRLNYTAMGDTVNLASRLEGINKYYGTHIIISEDVFDQVKAHFHCRILDRVAVKGKKRGINIYELLGASSTPLSEATLTFRDRYHEGINAYWGRDWKRAEELFRKMAEDYPRDKSVALLLSRCSRLGTDSSPAHGEWDKTFIFSNK